MMSMEFRLPHHGAALAVIWLFLVWIVPSVALAQNASDIPDLAGQLESALASHSRQMDQIEKVLANDNPDQERLTRLREVLQTLDDKILSNVLEIQPALSSLKSRLVRLPPAPKEGDPAEPEEIANERKALSDANAKTLLAMRDAELMTVRAGDLLDKVLVARRNLFVSRLFERRFLDTETVDVTRRESARYVDTVGGTIYVWLRSIVQNDFWKLALAIGLTVLVGIVLSMVLRPLRRDVLLGNSSVSSIGRCWAEIGYLC